MTEAKPLRDVLGALNIARRTTGDGPALEDWTKACGKCNDSGTVALPAKDPERPWVRELVACECWLERRQEKRGELLLAWCELTEATARKTFESYLYRTHTSGGIECVCPMDARDAAFDLARGSAERPWLLLTGTPGCGKSHLALAVVNWRREHDDGWETQGKFVNVPDFLDQLRDGYSDGTYEERFERYRNVSLLVLDDLGAHSGTAWAQEKLYQLLEHRSRERMDTVVTTNAKSADLPSRIVDRLLDEGSGLVRVVRLCAPSYRSGLSW